MVHQEQHHSSFLSRLERLPPRFSRIADPQATQTLHAVPYVEDAMVISNMIVHCSSLRSHVPLLQIHPPTDLSEASGYDNLVSRLIKLSSMCSNHQRYNLVCRRKRVRGPSI
jgi:hypothetical protein